MKKIIIIALTFIPLITTYSQSLDSNSTKYTLIGIYYSPDYCFENYKIVELSPGTKYYTWAVPKYGFTTGLSIIYNFNKRIAIETGMQFSNKGYKENKRELYGGPPDTNIMPRYASSITKCIYLDIPFKMNYYILTKRLKIFISGGISANILFQNKDIITYEYNDGRIETIKAVGTSDYSIINPAFLVGFGTEFNIADKIKVRIEPTYRRSITSINYEPAFHYSFIRYYLYSFGVNVGLYYKFDSM